MLSLETLLVLMLGLVEVGLGPVEAGPLRI